MKDLSLGGMTGGGRSTHLLDTSPLRRFLSEQINFEKIDQNIRNGTLFGVAVSATNYKTGTAITFFDGDPSIQPWVRSSRLGQRAKLTLAHVLASASIPVLFAPVPLGRSFFGDGSIRLNAPISPAIHLGADRILAVGVRFSRSVETTLELNQAAQMKSISLADICGVILNATLLDTMDADAERLERINQTVDLLSADQLAKHPGKLKKIPLLVIRPSQDLGALASEQFRRFPRVLRYLLSGIGASSEKGWDFLSYLAFDQAYTKILLELGYQDSLARRDEINEFFA
jgi:NTE family protein